MPERVHTRFTEGENERYPQQDQRVIPNQKSSPVEYSERPLKALSGKKRSATEAFQDRARNGNHITQLPTLGPATRQQPKVVDFTEESKDRAIKSDSKCHVPVSKVGLGLAAKQGHLKARARELLPIRNSLPIAPHAEELRSKLRENDVLLLVGETGSGKSTQVPQFLIDEPWCRRSNVPILSASGTSTSSDAVGSVSSIQTAIGGCIAITQPRRLAAISLASRVAAELGTPLGSSSPSSQVGYSVRFDTSVSPSTRIKFLTEGMLLQEMLRDPYLAEYSAVVVDEVHERGVNVDLVLGFLRKMVTEKSKSDGRGGVALKVVIMSATADMEGIEHFFRQQTLEPNHGPSNGIQAIGSQTKGSHSTVEFAHESDAESESSWSGISLSSTSDQPSEPKGDVTRGSCNSLVTTCHIKGRQYPVKTIYTPSPVQDILDSALHTIMHIHTHEPLPGDVLVFLTGQETVENLASMCQQAYSSLTQDPKTRSAIPKLLILPLFAALPQHAQQRVFERTPPRTRKVIVSTNIAETSLTVPGIRFVVDSGKCKKKQFRFRLGLDSLLVKPISKSAANQRKGRAGREAPGTCYRLYTEKDYLLLDQDNDPEILRCDLSQLVLNLKARGVDDVINFPLLTPPPREALERALLHLLQLQTLHPETGQITPLGLSIAKLPLSAALGRVLLASASPDFNCLPEAIDIISALSVENIFLHTPTEEAREAAASARQDLRRREGDHLTLLAAVQAYSAAENSDRRAWCQERFISHRAMQAVVDVRKQLLKLCKNLLSPLSSSSASSGGSVVTTTTTEDEFLPTRLLKAFLTGFAANTARLMPDGSYRTMMGNQTVAIHPSSVLVGRKCEAIMYNEFVFTAKSYARGVSMVEMAWVGEVFG